MLVFVTHAIRIPRYSMPRQPYQKQRIVGLAIPTQSILQKSLKIKPRALSHPCLNLTITEFDYRFQILEPRSQILKSIFFQRNNMLNYSSHHIAKIVSRQTAQSVLKSSRTRRDSKHYLVTMVRHSWRSVEVGDDDIPLGQPGLKLNDR